MKSLPRQRRILETAQRCRRHFGRFLRDQKPLLAAGCTAAVGTTVIEILRPWPLKFVIDYVLIPTGEPGPEFLTSRNSSEILWACASMLVVLPLLQSLLNAGGQIAIARVGRKITTRVRRLVCEHVQLLPLSFHHKSRTGDLLVRVMGDVSMVRDILFSGWVSLMQRVLIFVGTWLIMLWISPWIGLLALAPLPFLFWTVRRSGSRMKSAVARQRKKEGNAAALASELFTQIKGIKAFGAEERSARLFSGLTRSGERAGVKATKIAAFAGLKTEVVTGSGLALVLVLGANQVLGGSLTAGTLVLLLSYTRALYKPLRRISRDGIRLSKAAACADRIFEVLELPPETRGEGPEAPTFSGRIRFDEVCFSYEERAAAMDHASFDVRPGTVCLMTGHNGSGKSTALALLLRLMEPSAGRILVDEQPSDSFELSSWRRQFALVPQEDLLFSGTIGENILFGNPEASDSVLARALDETGLAPFIAGLPDGLDTAVGEHGTGLSGGQKRLVSLARASVREASVLILDEPLEGLDPEARIMVARAIRSLSNGRTTLIVSHTNVEEFAADQVLLFSDGRVRETAE